MKNQNRKELTPEELQELIGGDAQFIAPSDDDNINSTFQCNCWYDNTSYIKNSNTAQGCTCDCR